MKTASTILIIAAGAAVLAAIWTPIGSWWQWTITAIVLFLAGAGLSGAAGLRHHGTPQGSYHSDEHGLGALRHGQGNSERSADRAGNSTGPHHHFTTDTRPTYGKSEDNE